ncbi:ABC transporter substrate-binding protein [Phytoactinopolyspora limicola]|uniref:ABC transporter substrate-binding protein n=1 Tax=Phytoactinopolyspora limicola TaxID=2715536 RepID=UPI00140D9E00|nr:ABC transporter substrate-binding protein [Phytoactinopolyspora limicola]
MRIVSLLPSVTEILFALGAGDDVVGVTFECDYPPQARTKRIVSTSALPDGLEPAQIDQLVSARMVAGEDLYHLDEGALAGLDADLVITQDLCAVCAVDVSTVHDALDYLACRAEVLTVDPHTLTEVLASVLTIGEATGTRPAGEDLVASLTGRLDVVRDRISTQSPKRALVLEWPDPPFAPGHWVPDMIAAAGGVCVLGRSGERSFRSGWEEIVAAGADVVISAPCGYGLETSIRLAEDVVAGEFLPTGLPVWAVDANASFARPGPRLVDGVEALAGIFHPDVAAAPDAALARRVR